jgi:hypothetical protein
MVYAMGCSRLSRLTQLSNRALDVDRFTQLSSKFRAPKYFVYFGIPCAATLTLVHSSVLLHFSRESTVSCPSSRFFRAEGRKEGPSEQEHKQDE